MKWSTTPQIWNSSLSNVFQETNEHKSTCVAKKFYRQQENVFTTSSELDRFAAQSRVGCVIAISDHFVLYCDEMLRCRIVKRPEARRRIFRCLWMWSIARFETKAFWSLAGWWKILFRDFEPLKKWILKKLVGELETTVRLQKQRLHPASV